MALGRAVLRHSDISSLRLASHDITHLFSFPHLLVLLYSQSHRILLFSLTDSFSDPNRHIDSAGAGPVTRSSTGRSKVRDSRSAVGASLTVSLPQRRPCLTVDTHLNQIEPNILARTLLHRQEPRLWTRNRSNSPRRKHEITNCAEKEMLLFRDSKSFGCLGRSLFASRGAFLLGISLHR